MFREQQDRTTKENLTAGLSPAMESVYLYAQPKIYLLLRLVEYSGDHEEPWRDVRDETVAACSLTPRLQDKATIAHVFHYYSLKLGEIWNENDLLSHDPDDVPSPVESQSIDIMTVRHAYLMALIKMIGNEVAILTDTCGSVSVLCSSSGGINVHF